MRPAVRCNRRAARGFLMPALVPFVPPGVRWRHSVNYASQFQHGQWGDLYLDPDKAVAFFVHDDS